MDALQNFLGVDNNQILIRKYEIIGTAFGYNLPESADERGIIDIRFRKHSCQPDDTNTYKFINIFTFKEYLIDLLEKPVDDVTWLRIKQPGTYTIHFDLIAYSFSFELHTRDEILHFSEHNPKHDINLEKGENCLLVYKSIPLNIHAGSKIYVYFNI